jgi:hypothetical protein
MVPEFYTVAEVAKMLKISEDTVRSRFQKLHGVIDLGGPETRKKRGYRVLRIPRPILEKYLMEHTR